MTDRQNEQLSALLDAHFESESQCSESIENLVRNEDAQSSWFHYQLIGAVMRNEAKVGTRLDISAAVAAQVAREPAMIAPRKNMLAAFRAQQWLKPAANVAVAASVALVTVFRVMQYQRIDDGSAVEGAVERNGHQSVLQTIPMGGTLNPVSFTVQPARSINNDDSAANQERALQRAQLQAYMLDHELRLQWGVQQATEATSAEGSTEANESEQPKQLEEPPQ